MALKDMRQSTKMPKFEKFIQQHSMPTSSDTSGWPVQMAWQNPFIKSFKTKTWVSFSGSHFSNCDTVPRLKC